MIFLLLGCSPEGYVVTQELIVQGNSICINNGGLASVEYLDYSNEYESCGYKCRKPTGFVVNTGILRCVNGLSKKVSIRLERRDD